MLIKEYSKGELPEKEKNNLKNMESLFTMVNIFSTQRYEQPE